MTREEAIEAMARVLYAVDPLEPYEACRDHWLPIASAALDAARPWVEGLVREGVNGGETIGWDTCLTRFPDAEYQARKAEIVAHVMEGEVSLRDEIALKIAGHRHKEASEIADALMPLVERAVREAAEAAISDRHSEAQERAIIDAIVASILK
jgi:hypothetical protein